MSNIIPVTITFLQMTEKPALPHVPPPTVPHAVMHAEKPPVHFYRYMYDVIGREWKWVDRKRLDDDELSEIIHDENVEMSVLYVRGTPAGYAELDFREMPEAANLAYFGLMSDFQGFGLGAWFLRWSITEMWQRGPERVTVNTCTLDHPRALPLYQRMGFDVCGRQEIDFLDE